MYLKKLSLTGFKNYEYAEMELSPGINCFVGNNGVGKTNILDAVHYLSLTKSFFNNIDSLSIRHNDDFFILNGVFSEEGYDDTIHCSFQRGKQKTLKKNGKDYEKLSDHIGKYPVVMISPADSSLIIDGSEERRRFLNKIISQYSPEYLDSVIKYGKALQQRNRFLKDQRPPAKLDQDMLDVLDSQLIKYGNIIYRERMSLSEELTPVLVENYDMISSGRENVRLIYRSHLSEGDYGGILAASLNRDRMLEYTSTGIHKDDLVLEMDNHNVRTVGSQGQQKSFLVALKLAKFDYIARKSGMLPILLLDDIFDKFDAGRVEQIIRLVGNHRFGQIFITDTHPDRLKEILALHSTDYKLFEISDNKISEVIHNGK